jgi:hypothetical protein
LAGITLNPAVFPAGHACPGPVGATPPNGTYIVTQLLSSGCTIEECPVTPCAWNYSGTLPCGDMSGDPSGPGANPCFYLSLQVAYAGNSVPAPTGGIQVSCGICPNVSSSGFCKCCDTTITDTCGFCETTWLLTDADYCTLSGTNIPLANPGGILFDPCTLYYDFSAATCVVTRL